MSAVMYPGSSAETHIMPKDFILLKQIQDPFLFVFEDDDINTSKDKM